MENEVQPTISEQQDPHRAIFKDIYDLAMKAYVRKDQPDLPIDELVGDTTN